MNEKIKHYLQQVEDKNNITILLACETGSRAWGFPSPDSDYDVRIIYVHKRDWYLSLFDKKDSIEMFLENKEIDISGWDLRKSLRLLGKSNPPLLERIQSHIVYYSDNMFLKEINELASKAYSKIATIHHYLSLAKKSFAGINNGENYNLKKLFYALRAATACKWILEMTPIPPIEFKIMLNELSIEKNLTKRIKELIILKSFKSESYLHQGEREIFNFIEDCISRAEADGKNLSSSVISMEELNSFFRKYIPG